VKKFPICALALLLACAGAAPAATQSTDEKLIHAMMVTFSAAFRAKDVNTIMSMYVHSKDLTAFDVAPPLRYIGWDAYKKDYQQFFASFAGPIDDRIQSLKIVVDGSMAYSEDTERISGTLTTGHKAAMIVRATDVYRKIGGKWLIVHEHVSVPVDYTTDKAVFEAK
jgi:ketosteroid isomerase-like protein